MMAVNIFDKTINNDQDIKIDVFHRDLQLDKKIDSFLYKNKGYSGLRVYSISTYIDRLNEHVDSYNSDRFGRVELFQFLKYSSKFDFNYEIFPTEMWLYINKLNDFVIYLKRNLDVPHLNYFQNNVELFIRKFINYVISLDFDLNLVEKKYHPYAKVRSYGLIVNERNLNYIYIVNNNDVTGDIKHKPACVLYLRDSFEKDKFSELISMPGVNNVVVFNNENDINYYHKLSLSANHGRVYYDVLRLLNKNFDDDNSVIESLKNKINKLVNRLANFEEGFRYKVYEFNRHKFECEAKSLKATNQNIIFELKELHGFNHLIVKAEHLTRALGFLEEKYFNYNSIDEYLHSSLSIMKKNRFLYRGRSKGTLFSEENLSAILKTMLELKFNHDFISVTQEEINGAGFSDIEIKIKNVTISIIECKLVKPKNNSNMESSLTKGMDQILYRYSSPLREYFDMPPKLYLMLFCVDPKWNVIRKKASEALEDYCKRANFKIIYKENYNSTTLSVSLEREEPHFGVNILNLDIVICELEDKVDLDRTNIKPYSKSK